MDEMLHTVKNITIFILLFSVVSNLFSQSKYRQYFDFIQGIVILILVMTPLFSSLTSEEFLDRCLSENMDVIERRSYEDELRMIGEQRERMLRGLAEEEGGRMRNE